MNFGNMRAQELYAIPYKLRIDYCYRDTGQDCRCLPGKCEAQEVNRMQQESSTCSRLTSPALASLR
jgi:hypothetical protein